MTIQSINANRPDPNSYAQTYATQNNISLSDAKEQLKAKYGDPSQESMFRLQNVTTSDTYNFSTSNNDFQDPNSYAENYASENGLSIEDAIAELESLYGEPQQADNEFDLNPFTSQTNDPDEFAQMYADAKGISLDEAKAELKELYGDPVQQ